MQPTTLILLSVVLIFTTILPAHAESCNVNVDFTSTDIFFHNPCAPNVSSGCNASNPSLVGDDNPSKAFNYFVSQGLIPFQSAGIVGNLMQESHVDPKSIQPGGLGRGIAQWSEGGRWEELKKHAQGGDPWDLAVQLEFLWYEMNSVSPWNKTLPAISASQNIEEATKVFEELFEKAGTPNMDVRIKYAKDVLAKYGGGTVSGGTAGCQTGGPISGDIAKTALALAWPTKGGHGTEKKDAIEAYQVAMPKYNDFSSAAEKPWTDCGVFVATVMHASGADKDYPGRGTAIQGPYVRSHPEKYTIIKESDKLEPGDILVKDAVHTYIYTGPYQGQDNRVYNAAQGSLYDHVPEAANFYPDGFTVARLKK